MSDFVGGARGDAEWGELESASQFTNSRSGSRPNSHAGHRKWDTSANTRDATVRQLAARTGTHGEDERYYEEGME